MKLYNHVGKSKYNPITLLHRGHIGTKHTEVSKEFEKRINDEFGWFHSKWQVNHRGC